MEGFTNMDWADIASKFGVPATVLAVVFYGVWKSLTWTAENVVKPIVEAHRNYLDKTAADTANVAASLRESDKRQAEQNTAMQSALEVIKQTNIQSAGALEQIKVSIPTICRAAINQKQP